MRAETAEENSRAALLGPWGVEAERGLIIVSNRGPYEFTYAADGTMEAHRGAGGVVSGLMGAAGERNVTWIALAMSDADRMAARARGKATILEAAVPENIALRLVDVPPTVYQRHYDGISNRLLWFTQHYLLRPTATDQFSERTARDWEQGYSAVNAAVADAVIAELQARGTATPVLFQDYHLYLAPARVRAAQPDARLTHFVHIPWPDSRYWELLPERIVRDIFEGLAANDLVGFQTRRDAQNFIEGARRFLIGANIMRDANGEAEGLEWQGRRVLVRAYPIAVTPNEVRENAQAEDACAEAEALCSEISDDMQLIVRVDRVEPTKNIVRGFQAYERMLVRHPEMHGKVTFLALLVPSRQGMREYQTYERQVRRQVERVNARFGRPDWQPIVAVFGNHRARALACMRRYDALLVNPVIDGMNLVVKEGGLANERDGVIVLSRTAGAFEQLGEHVLDVAPLDVRATAEALYRALTLSPEERHERAEAIRDLLDAEDATQWLEGQLTDLSQHLHTQRVSKRRAELRSRVIPADEATTALRSLPTDDAAPVLRSVPSVPIVDAASVLPSIISTMPNIYDSGDGLALSM